MGVTASEHLEKQPGETRTYTMDFSNLMASDETIDSINTVTSELRGGGTSDLTLVNSAISGQTVLTTISGGTDRCRYRIMITITTSTSQVLQGDGILKVSDK